ncbi:MAG: 50S ribosomal protein L25 [Patescibacteria group bacterium]|nr:50S ribosomal protein L25 [Patescibacteria group bacterium]
MQEIKLKVQKREVLGRKVKNLRKEKLVPGNVYGKKIKSFAISLDKDEFLKIYKEAGETSVVKLIVDGEKEERPILIQNIQTNPVSDEVLHVDLRQIILTEKVTANIPVELVGEAPAVAQKLGILIQAINEIEVEALPMDLPESFSVDVSKLVSVGDEVKLSDLSFDRNKVKVTSEDDIVLARIEPLAAEEKVVAPVAEAPAEGEAAPAEGAEPKAESEAKAAEKEEKKE